MKPIPPARRNPLFLLLGLVAVALAVIFFLLPRILFTYEATVDAHIYKFNCPTKDTAFFQINWEVYHGPAAIATYPDGGSSKTVKSGTTVYRWNLKDNTVTQIENMPDYSPSDQVCDVSNRGLFSSQATSPTTTAAEENDSDLNIPPRYLTYSQLGLPLPSDYV
ncbi:MAG: hypothetical protein WCO52_03580 [bacterium]